MRTLEIKLYKFSELSEEAKKVAIEKEQNYRYENGEPLLFFKEYCEERLRELGFELKELNYSLSYCQGDGLSFSGKYTDLTNLFAEVLGKGKLLTAELLAENCTQIIKGNNGRYCFGSKSDVDLYLENYTSSINVINTNNIDAVIGKVLSTLEDKYMEACKELEKEGYEWIESYNSEQSCIEELEQLDNEYTEDGKQY